MFSRIFDRSKKNQPTEYALLYHKVSRRLGHARQQRRDRDRTIEFLNQRIAGLQSELDAVRRTIRANIKAEEASAAVTLAPVR